MKRPVAFGSDFNGVARHVGPRFGDDACAVHKVAGQSEAEEAAGPKLAYPFEMKGFGVFDRQVTGQCTFDFNTDGLAHIGMYPDLIAAMRAVGVSDTDLEPLFQSVQAYVEAWSRAEKLGR